MASLADKIRKAREFKREIGGFKLTLRRPTEVEYARLNREKADYLALGEAFVIDWEGVTEADLVVSGGANAVAFEPGLWAEVLADRHDLWEPIAKAVEEAFVGYLDAKQGREKN